MFPGIVEEAAQVVALQSDKGDLHLTAKCSSVNELKISQGVARNGACLTVVSMAEDTYMITAIKETLERSNLGNLEIDGKASLERSVLMNGRLDRHIVQGHVDQTTVCAEVEEANGSWYYTFEYALDEEIARQGCMTMEKGSVHISDISLTVCNPRQDSFQVAVIPYTHNNTSFCQIEKDTVVSPEFDIVRKYISKMTQLK